LVGEEGPELVNFSNPGRVYTAAETQEMLSRGQDLPPDLARRAAGSDPSEAVAPMGGNLFSNIGRAVGGWLRQGDRKSTRLNSSHVKISYAVFCLKKKINI